MAVDGAATAPDDLIELGRIISAYGVRGWVKIQPHSAQGTVLRAAPVWWLVAPVAPLAKPGAPVPHKVKQVRPQGSTVVADLEGVGERDLAESLRGYAVLVSRQHFPKAQTDEYYWVDLIGLDVVNREGLALGQVRELLHTGPQTVLVLAYLEEGKSKERMIPFVGVYIDAVDLVSKRITADWQADFDT
jgi:16S rRNA processing protein RimM